MEIACDTDQCTRRITTHSMSNSASSVFVRFRQTVKRLTVDIVKCVYGNRKKHTLQSRSKINLYAYAFNMIKFVQCIHILKRKPYYSRSSEFRFSFHFIPFGCECAFRFLFTKLQHFFLLKLLLLGLHQPNEERGSELNNDIFPFTSEKSASNKMQTSA